MTNSHENKHYTTRKKKGAEQRYSNPDDLLSKAFEYFAWCEDNPWYKKELMRSGDRKGEIVDVPMHRPYLLVGLCVYCGISEKTFHEYEANPKLKEAAAHIRDIIKQNQLEGATLGAYNSNLVSRLLGLTDTQDQIGLSGGQSLTINVSNPITKVEIESLKNKLSEEAE